MDNLQLSGRRAVVTGASGGIGNATATLFEQSGASVIRHANKTKGPEFMNADFERPDDVDRFLDTVWKQSPKLDIWVNAAGADLMTREMKALSFEERLRKIMEIDVFTTFNLSRKVGERMKADGSGTLVFFTWDGVTYGWSGETAQIYGAAKGAVLGFCRSLAETLSPEVRVCCLSLGWIRTRWGVQASEEFQQLGANDSLVRRWGEPSEVADAVLYLVSQQSSFVDGINIRINGGKRFAK